MMAAGGGEALGASADATEPVESTLVSAKRQPPPARCLTNDTMP